MAENPGFAVWKVNEHPPLFYALLSVWNIFLDDDFGLRLLPLILGVLTIPVFYFLGLEVDGRNTGLLAATLLAVFSYHVRYSRDITAYSLLLLTFSLALLFSLQVAKNPSLLKWVCYTLSGSLLAYSQGLAPLYLFLISLSYFVFINKKIDSTAVWPWLIANLTILAIFSPWLTTYLDRASAISSNFWIDKPLISDLLIQFHVLATASIPPVSTITSVKAEISGLNILGPWIWAAPVYLLLLASIIKTVQRKSRVRIGFWLLLICPIAIIFFISLTIRPIFITRQLFPIITPMVLLISMTIMSDFSHKKLRTLCFMLIVSIFTLSSFYHIRYMNKEDWKGVSNKITQSTAKEALILHYGYGIAGHYLINRYTAEKNRNAIIIESKKLTPSEASGYNAYSFGNKILINTSYLEALIPRQYSLHSALQNCQSVTSRCLSSVVERIKPGSSIWIVQTHEQYLPDSEIINKWILDNFSILKKHRFNQIWLFEAVAI